VRECVSVCVRERVHLFALCAGEAESLCRVSVYTSRASVADLVRVAGEGEGEAHAVGAELLDRL
jgi:hypothetical protein